MTTLLRSVYQGGEDGVFLLENGSPQDESAVVLRLRAQGADVDITWDGTTLTVPGAGGGIAIGDPVTGGSPGSILFIDGEGNLGQSFALGYTDGNFYVEDNFPGSNLAVTFKNDSDAASSTVSFDLRTAADADAALTIANATKVYGLTVDASDGSKLVLDAGGSVWTADGTTFEVVDVLKINNTVSAAVATASTHRVAINIGGNDYFLLMTNVA